MTFKTGTSMNGKIENFKKISTVKSNCRNCFHCRKVKDNHRDCYCDYYKTINPNRKSCSRYYALEKLTKEESEQIKKHNKSLLESRNKLKKTSLELLSKRLGVEVTLDMIFHNNKQKLLGNKSLKIQPINKEDATIVVFFKDGNRQKYKIIK